MRPTATYVAILLLLAVLISLASSELSFTPAGDGSMKIYGSLEPKGDHKNWSKLSTITVRSPAETTAVVQLQYVVLKLYALPDAIEIPLEINSANFDSEGQLTWDIKRSLPTDNSGVVVDIDVHWAKITWTDDKEITSKWEFAFEAEGSEEPQVVESVIPYNHLQYDDSSFDSRFEVYITQAQKTTVTNTLYRFSAILYDTTRWKPKSLQLTFVGPLTFAKKINNGHYLGEDEALTRSQVSQLEKDYHRQSNPHSFADLPQNIPLTTTDQPTDAVLCYMNSLEQIAEINYDTGVLTFTFTTDFDVVIPYRGALSIHCPELYVVQKYPLTPSFDAATRSIATIAIYGDLESTTKNLLDMRQQNVGLFSFVHFPTAVRGGGFVENNRVMATYSVQYPEGSEIHPKKDDELFFEWQKIALQNQIHNYAIPYHIYNATSSWATQQVTRIDNRQGLDSTFNIKYRLADIFNADGITLEDFIVSSYAVVSDKNPTIDAVNVFRYTTTARHMGSQTALRGTDGQAVQSRLDLNNFDQVLADIVKNNPEMVATFLTTVGPDLEYRRRQAFGLPDRLLAVQQGSKGKTKGKDVVAAAATNEDGTPVLPPLQFARLTAAQKFDLILYSNDQRLRREADRKPTVHKSRVSFGTVPQLKRYGAVSDTVSFEDEHKQFKYAINGALSQFDTIQFLFPRGATIFHGNFATCLATITHLSSNGLDDQVDTFRIAAKDDEQKSQGQLQELIFNLAALNKVVGIGESISFHCPNGGIEYRPKQPVFATEYITCQTSLSRDGNADLNTATPDEVSFVAPLTETNLHAVRALRGVAGSVVNQTTISFTPNTYVVNITLMLIVLLVFLTLSLLAVFIMPLLACINVIQLDESNSITPPTPVLSVQGGSSGPVVHTTGHSSSFCCNPSSGHLSSSSMASTPGYLPIATPQQQQQQLQIQQQKTTQYGTIDFEDGEKKLKSILKRK